MPGLLEVEECGEKFLAEVEARRSERRGEGERGERGERGEEGGLNFFW